MKRFIIILFVFMYSINIRVYATDSIQINSGEDDVKISSELNSEKIRNNGSNTNNSGEKNLSEEGTGVDTSIINKNFEVEAPTIVLLSLFGILTFISIILFVMKV